MHAYARTYQLAWTLALPQTRKFRIPVTSRLYYAAKAANLSICFLGFSVRRGAEYFRRSAELGVLASLFDLTSDGQQYDPSAARQFETIVSEIADGETSNLIVNLLKRKESGKLQVHGLDRGVDALRIVLKHLRAEKLCKSDSDIYEVGILCQIVDDVLDRASDLNRGELNFLRYEDSDSYIHKLLEWDYKKQLCNARYPFMLFQAIQRAKVIAAKLELRRPGSIALTPLGVTDR